MVKQIINSKNAPKAMGAYSQATKLNNLVFVSGQLPVDPITGEISGDIGEQVHQSIRNIFSILKEAG